MDESKKRLFEDSVKSLIESPLYSMSLGSKELFHSNFWVWIFEQKKYKKFINCFFEHFDLTTIKSIQREDKNRDIVLYDTKGNEFVIENKIKSYATIEQIKRYKADIGVLTGINKPPFNLPNNWRFLSYSMIADHLRSLLLNDGSFVDNLLKEYCDMLRNIHNALLIPFEDKQGLLSFDSSQIQRLSHKQIRLHDVYRKIKADDFVIHLSKLRMLFPEGETEFTDWYFYIYRSFNHGNATITFVYKNIVFEQIQKEIGIQIEGNQFRFFYSDLDQNIDDIFKQAVDFGWFDNLSIMHGEYKVRHYSSSMRNMTNKYGKHWLYQYFDIYNNSDQNLQNYEVLEKILIKELTNAKEILGKLTAH